MTDDDLRRLFDETRRHFDVVAERTDRKVELLAEAVASLREDLHGEVDELREETRRGFAETQARSNSRMRNSTVAFAR